MGQQIIIIQSSSVVNAYAINRCMYQLIMQTAVKLEQLIYSICYFLFKSK